MRLKDSPVDFTTDIASANAASSNSIRTLLGKPVTYGLQTRHYIVVVVTRFVDSVEHVTVVRPCELMQRSFVVDYLPDLDVIEVAFVHRIKRQRHLSH